MLKFPDVFVLLIINFLIHLGSTFGETCYIRSTNRQGTCKPLHECDTAINDLKESEKLPQICKFEEYTPIVCCLDERILNFQSSIQHSPPVVTKPKRKIGEISRKKCEEYSKLVNFTMPNPIAMIGAPPITRHICTMQYKPMIVGGEVAQEYEFPHMALVGYAQENGNLVWACGGSLISEKYVLTAGHCLSSFLYGPAKYVRLGVNSRELKTKYTQERKISDLIRHPKYKPPSHYNDIGLFKLKSKIDMNPRLRPACLYTEEILDVKDAVATGWGTVSFYGDTSDDLLKVALKIFDSNSCNESYSGHINRKLRHGILPDRQVCAGTDDDDPKDTCQGDSGGPLQIYNKKNCTYEIIGITSFGKACGISSAPGVYTKVSSYTEWIENIVWPSE